VVSFAGKSFEISSMGIRVDENSLLSQLKEAGCEERKEMKFHKDLLQGSSLTPLEGYRTVEDLHVFSEEGSYRRGSIFGMAGFND